MIQVFLHWLKTHSRRVSFIVGALLFFITLLVLFYAKPEKVLAGSVNDRSSKTPTTIIHTNTPTSTTKNRDYSALSSKLKEGKSDGITLLILLLIAGAGFMLYSFIKKEDKK